MSNIQDPIALAKAMDETWNAHDVDGAMSFFTDDAVVRLYPPPVQNKDVLEGKDQIRQWVESFMNQDFHVESSNYATDGHMVSWDSKVYLRQYKEMGLYPAEFHAEVTVRGSKISSFTAIMSDRSFKQANLVAETGLEDG